MSKVKKIQFLGFVTSVLTIVVGLAITALVLGTANGYRIDFTNFKVDKVGAIVINAVPNGSTAKIGKNEHNLTSFSNMISLLPGRYDISINKEGYQEWKNFVRLESGQAIVFDKVYLFLKEPKLNLERAATLAEQAVLDANPIVLVSGGEIRLKLAGNAADLLVTRLSESIVSAELLDDNHIVFQVNSQVRIIEKAGTNDTFILDLGENDPVKLIPRQNGTILAIVKNGVLKEYKIR